MALRVGIVGTGWGVRTQVPAFRRAGLNVVALCGRDLAKVSDVMLAAPCSELPQRRKRLRRSFAFLMRSTTGATW